MFLHPSVCPQGGRCYDVTSCYGQHSTPPPPGQQEGGTHPTGMLSCFLFMTCQPSFHILGDIYINYTLKLSSCNKSTLLPASTELGQGNIFTSVCLSTGGRGVCLSSCWDTHPPPGADHPPSGADTQPPPPWEQTPPPGSRLQHTVNERPVRILLECTSILFSASCLWIIFVRRSETIRSI